MEWWQRIDRVLELHEEEAPLPPEIANLAEERERARLAKDWKKSDELRDQLNALGWDARDTKGGQKVTRRAGS
jgi:cysteinyl-tRNA synthetase